MSTMIRRDPQAYRGARRRTAGASAALALASLAGCPRELSDDAVTATEPPEDGATTVSTRTTADTETETSYVVDVSVDEDCAVAPPAGPIAFSSTIAIRTQGDFDFDGAGFLDAQRQGGLSAYSRTGDRHLVAANVGYLAGIRSLPTGDVVASAPNLGQVTLVTYAYGDAAPFVGGIQYPSGLEAGADGMMYVSDYAPAGRVWTFDPYSGDGAVVVDLPFPNGLALSVDEQTLYVATSSGWFHGTGTVAAVDRDQDGRWDATTLHPVYDASGRVDALAVDVCDNLYIVELETGRVVRIRAIDHGVELIADLGASPGGYTSARFGTGLGGFERDQLFVSNGSELWVLEVGVDGRHVLAEPASGATTPE